MKLKALLNKFLEAFFETEAATEEYNGEMSSFDALIAGLGNPGPKYAMTRHNVGFLAIETLANKLGVTIDKHKFEASFTQAEYKGKRLILAAPQTFMNLSGISISGLSNFFKIPPEKIIIIHDDIDLETERLFIRKGGGDGGHKGIRSISGSLGTQDYLRIRVGIGRPKERGVTDFVLEKFTAEEEESLVKTLEKASDAALEILTNGFVKAQNLFHSKRNLKAHNEAGEQEKEKK